MDENLTRGYCQLHSSGDTSQSRRRIEIVSSPPPSSTRGRHRARSEVLPPLDNYRLIYLALILCGAGFLLPYNSFITAVDFYQSRYPASTIVFDMSLTYICSAFVGVVISNVLVEKLSLHVRITVGYLLSFVILLFITFADVRGQLFSPSTSYCVTLVAVAIVALGCTVQQSSFYGYTSMLPPRYTQAVMTGESAAGLIVSINRVITKALMHDVRTSTLLFFFISIAFVVVCCAAFQATRCTDFVQFYVSICRSAASVSDDQLAIMRPSQTGGGEDVSLVDILDGSGAHDSYGVLVIQSPTNNGSASGDTTATGHQSDRMTTTSGSNCPGPGLRQVVGPTARGHQSSSNNDRRWMGRSYRKQLSTWDSFRRAVLSRLDVSKRIWSYMLSICIVYFVTLSLFPGIESEIVSCRLGSWMPILLFAVFNLFDFIGKILASVQYQWARARLLLCCIGRLVLVPLMMLCAAPRSRPILSNEAWSVIISLTLGLSNGYFGSVPIITAPTTVLDHQKELTGNMMTLSYSVGLTTGSAVAYLLNSWLGPYTSPDHVTCQQLVNDMTQLNSTSSVAS